MFRHNCHHQGADTILPKPTAIQQSAILTHIKRTD